MEADWQVELGGDAAVIDGAWPGTIDLRAHPERIAQLSELHDWPELAGPLLRLNSAESPLRTSKCDVWWIEDFASQDRDEFAANSQDLFAVCSYIDLLDWPSLAQAEAFVRTVVAQLRGISLKPARVDLIVRAVALPNLIAGSQCFGVTAYVTGCGPSQQLARATWAQALDALVSVLVENKK